MKIMKKRERRDYRETYISVLSIIPAVKEFLGARK
jgi:hypothetical protein